MHRVGFLWDEMISDNNIRMAIFAVNQGHRRHKKSGKPNKTTVWVEETVDDRVEDLRAYMLSEGNPFSPTRDFIIYDQSAGKFREIHEPKQWPDQYLHHCLIQVLMPVMMRGMDYWCMGSIKKRGSKRGADGIKKWMHNDPQGTRWCLEADIKKFYDSLKAQVVIDDFSTRLIKDSKVMQFIVKVLKYGIYIGAYFSQWFANTVLQPIDQMIRDMGASHYIRYMDNFTIFATSKKKLHKIRKALSEALAKMGLKLKENWQIFKVNHRPATAMGYRFGHDFCMLRKRNVLRVKRQLKRYYKKPPRCASVHTAQSLISRLGQFKHCDNLSIYSKHYKKGTVANLKNTVRSKK